MQTISEQTLTWGKVSPQRIIWPEDAVIFGCQLSSAGNVVVVYEHSDTLKQNEVSFWILKSGDTVPEGTVYVDTVKVNNELLHVYKDQEA